MEHEDAVSLGTFITESTCQENNVHLERRQVSDSLMIVADRIAAIAQRLENYADHIELVGAAITIQILADELKDQNDAV